MAIRSEPMLHSRFLETNSSKSKINKIAFEYECKLISITDANKYNKNVAMLQSFYKSLFYRNRGISWGEGPHPPFCKNKIKLNKK